MADTLRRMLESGELTETLRRMLESGKLTETLRRMLESGKLTDEQCLSILQVLDSDGCTSEKVIEEKTVKRLNMRISLTQLLEMRDPEKSDLRRRYDEEVEEEEWQPLDERYHPQLEDSQYFDIDRDVRIPRWSAISPFYFGDKEEEQEPPPEMVLYGRLGVHWFNFEHNRNLKFIRIPKLNTGHPNAVSFYITVEVEDVDAAAGGSSPSSLTLQTQVSRFFFPELEVMIERCRIKPTTAIAEEPYSFVGRFIYPGVDELYKGPMPTFLSVPPEEADDDQRFYEVQDEDIRKNDWLLLYTHFALFKVCEAESHSFLPEEIELKKILVQTRETTQYDDYDDYDDDDDYDDEPLSSILKSMNAIFHISFSVNCRDYTSVVRRTTDGLTGHMRLEVEVEPAKKQGD